MKQKIENNDNYLFPSGLALIAGLTVFLFNSSIVGPTIQPDEGSYLAIAAAIAGFPNDFASSFHGGYSIFISLAFFVAETPQIIWGVVRAINATLFASSVLALFLLAKHFSPNCTLREKAVAVGVVSLYPAGVIMAGYSSSQVAFVPVFLFMLLSYLRAIHRERGSWMVLGVISGLLYWIHPTAAAPIIAIICGSFYIASKRNRYDLFVILLLTIISMVLLYKEGMNFIVQEHMSISGRSPNYHYPDAMEFLSPLFSLTGIKEVVARITGQIFYFSLGSVGLFWLGLFALTPTLFNEEKPSDNTLLQENAVAIFIWLALVGTMMMTALLFTWKIEAQRLDQWFYGRYVEGVIAPILLAGALNISNQKVLWAIPIAILCTWVFYSEIDSYSHVLRVNIPALWQDYFLHEQEVWGWLVAGVLLVFVVAMVPPSMRIMIVAAVFSFSNYLHIKAHVSSSVDAKNRSEEALAVRGQFAPGTCVGFDYSGVDSYNKYVFWMDFGFVLYDYQLQRTSYDHWLDSCNGPLFSYSDNVNRQNTDVYLRGTSPAEGPMVWGKRNI
ncbi:MAG: hypothetical protein KAH20_01835 [Methylococcales bacterium]|nr:hypothetical protein [Methylococcales bacterium]